ncbi:MAG: HEPN domain-containing protein [Pseudomonadota bacterium]
MHELVESNFKHIRDLARSIDSRLGHDTAVDRKIRSELSGMFAVTIVATYESIVKETLIEYAGRFHPKYQAHVESDFSKMNARISLDNLKSYSKQFGLAQWTGPNAPKNATVFHRLLSERRKIVERRFRKDLSTSYSSLFQWRNDYAHERTATTTFSEVYEAHRVAQYVIRTFVGAFDKG